MKSKKILYWIIFLLIVPPIFYVNFLILKSIAVFFDMKSWHAGEWIGFSQLIVYIIAALIAAITIYTNIKTSRERATLDTILNDHNDHSFQKSKRIVLDFAKKIDNDPHHSSKITELFLPPKLEKSTENNSQLETLTPNVEQEKTLSELKDAFLLVMNRHEFYATGINSGLLDEIIFKRANCNTFIKIWDAFSSTVIAIRKHDGKETIFKDLEILAVKWKLDPLTEEDLTSKQRKR